PAVGGADAALGAEDEELLAAQLGRVPAHAGVLAPAEDIATGGVEEQLLGQRQTASRAGGLSVDVVEHRVRFGQRSEERGGGGVGFLLAGHGNEPPMNTDKHRSRYQSAQTSVAFDVHARFPEVEKQTEWLLGGLEVVEALSREHVMMLHSRLQLQ